MNNIFPGKIVNNLLCSCNFKFPMYNNHYMTGKNICIFSKFACIENTLSSFTNNCKGLCNNLICSFRK